MVGGHKSFRNALPEIPKEKYNPVLLNNVLEKCCKKKKLYEFGFF